MRVPVFRAGITCLLAALFTPAAPAAQTHGNPVPPEPTVVHTGTHQALPAARVDAALKDYDRWLDQLASENRTAGLATAVVVNDKVRYERTLGYADANTNARVEPDTVFRLAGKLLKGTETEGSYEEMGAALPLTDAENAAKILLGEAE